MMNIAQNIRATTFPRTWPMYSYAPESASLNENHASGDADCMMYDVRMNVPPAAKHTISSALPIVFSGSIVSSAIVVTESNPRNDMQRIDAPANMPAQPTSGEANSTELKNAVVSVSVPRPPPPAIYFIENRSIATRNISWITISVLLNIFVKFIPNRFTIVTSMMKTAMNATIGTSGISMWMYTPMAT